MNYYNQIKQELINNELYKKAKDYSKNRSDLNTFYNVGKLLNEAGKHYGRGIIKEYSKRLTNELGLGYSTRNLYNMKLFFELFPNLQAVPANLTWTHICQLLSINDDTKRTYYINLVDNNNLSYRQLCEKIKSNEYERLDSKTKIKLITKDKSSVEDFIKNPIMIRNKNNINLEHLSEKLLKQLILEDIEHFMSELGNGFCYIDNEYKIKLGDTYNYIDLLLYNYIYNCFVVIELKVIELKAEHIGQIRKYMNYIDINVKKVNQNKTIGIIIAKKNNKFVIQYCGMDFIYFKEFNISK